MGKKCPFCAETIKDEAIVCRYCGRELPDETPVSIASGAAASLAGQQGADSAGTPISESPPVPDETRGRPSKPGSAYGTALVVVSVLLLVSLGLAAVLWASSRGEIRGLQDSLASAQRSLDESGKAAETTQSRLTAAESTISQLRSEVQAAQGSQSQVDRLEAKVRQQTTRYNNAIDCIEAIRYAYNSTALVAELPRAITAAYNGQARGLAGYGQ